MLAWLRKILFKPVLWASNKFTSKPDRPRMYNALSTLHDQIIKEEKSLSPFLLLDDVFEKLDEERISNLLVRVCSDEETQIFITDTSCDRLRQQMGRLERPMQMIQL